MTKTADVALDLLLIEVAGQRYALPLASVRSIHRAVAAAPVPGAPTIIEGAINVRGQVVPVLNIRHRFGLPGRDVEPDDQLVMALAGDRVVALRVDRALELVSVRSCDVQGTGSLSPHVALFVGVVTLQDGVVLIHDLAAFLTDAERADVDAVLSVRAATAGAP
jgi:purine-binding chemotaxis protein CheW